ncbi:unnamed protein product [Sphenostylis stenocarpa]|uniref:pectinesterase n=1 Tax=Sphenostylis stenocarpa TaxID=92480 RepID=A0AA86TEJ6_9FABA|nr:unnamed protein product [Sphenostylis stenocarpa]
MNKLEDKTVVLMSIGEFRILVEDINIVERLESCVNKGAGQAVALRVTADRCAFYNCRFLGWQYCTLGTLSHPLQVRRVYNCTEQKLSTGKNRCVVTGNGGTSYAYLGRPWRPFARVVFAFTFMDQCIKPAGCSGPGFCPSQRVKWARELKNEGAEQFLSHTFIDPESDRSWLPQRMTFNY